MRIETALMLLPGLIIGLTFHEAAHAVSAKWLGDPTAEKMGRVSLNPLRHLSLLGTAALFIIGFGWGRPVPVNITNFRKPKFHYLLTSLAGPAVNLIISVVALGILYLRPHPTAVFVLTGIYMVNALLAVFNLLPVPPLDGSKIWPCIIPGGKPIISGKWTIVWMVVLVVSLYTGVINRIMDPVFGFLFRLLPS